MLEFLISRWKQLCLLAICTSLSLAVGEWALRVLLDGRHRAAVASFEHAFYELAPDGGYLYRLKPGLRLPMTILQPDGSMLNWSINTDAQGCRGPDLDISQLGSTTKRILFVGDSYTFGYAAEERDSFPRVIERLLRARGRDVVAINAGIPGFNSVQEYHYLVHLLDVFAPDSVVLAYVANDAEPTPNVPLPPAMVHARSLSWTWEECKPLANAVSNVFVGDGDLFLPTMLRERFLRFENFKPDDPAWRASGDAVRDMAALCERRGIPFCVASMPSFVKPFDATYPLHAVHRQVTQWGVEHGFRTVDLLSAVLGRDVRTLSVPNDGHPNAEGHRLLAEALVDQIEVPR